MSSQEKNYLLPFESPTSVAAEPHSQRKDWGHTNLNIPDAWKTATGKGVTVAVCDTGVDYHQDLQDAIVAARDFTGSRSGTQDVQGHGTHCAGIVGARNNDTGLVGVAPNCKLINAKVLGDGGSGTGTGIANGIRWAIQQNVDVISLSLGSDEEDPQIKAAVQDAIKAGKIVCAAAGNSGPNGNTIGYPGGTDGVCCVAATDVNDRVANFSSRGRQLTISAPGLQIDSTYPGNRYALLSGTSMATPYVAGIAALFVEHARANNQPHDQKAFVDALVLTAKQKGTQTDYGAGLAQPVPLLDTIQQEKPSMTIIEKLIEFFKNNPQLLQFLIDLIKGLIVKQDGTVDATAVKDWLPYLKLLLELLAKLS
jgi:subtilisin